MHFSGGNLLDMYLGQIALEKEKARQKKEGKGRERKREGGIEWNRCGIFIHMGHFFFLLQMVLLLGHLWNWKIGGSGVIGFWQGLDIYQKNDSRKTGLLPSLPLPTSYCLTSWPDKSPMIMGVRIPGVWKRLATWTWSSEIDDRYGQRDGNTEGRREKKRDGKSSKIRASSAFEPEGIRPL